MALYTAEGIVLRTRNLGEADRIVTLYAREQGKVEAVARGARRVRSRLTGATQIFTHGRYVLFSGRTLDTLSQAEIVQSFAPLREDLIKMAHASYLAELLDVCVEPGEPSEDLFALVLGGLQALAAGVDPRVVSRHFELTVMSLLGYAPHVDSCVACRGEAEGRVSMSAREGGILCERCRSADPTAIRLERSTLEWVRRLLATRVDRMGVFRIGADDLRLLEAVGRAFVDLRVPRPLKSLSFLASVRDLA